MWFSTFLIIPVFSYPLFPRIFLLFLNDLGLSDRPQLLSLTCKHLQCLLRFNVHSLDFWSAPQACLPDVSASAPLWWVSPLGVPQAFVLHKVSNWTHHSSPNHSKHMSFPHLAVQQMYTWQILCSVWEYINAWSASLCVEANVLG